MVGSEILELYNRFRGVSMITKNQTRIINLKKDTYFISQYVNLRNHYVDLLLTNQLNIKDTLDWIKGNVEVRCLLNEDEIIGVVILYLDKSNEITVFTKYHNKGIGSKMLNIIEKVAIEKKQKNVWAWTLFNNLAAQKLFIKNGYMLEKETAREHRNATYRGFVFRKQLI